MAAKSIIDARVRYLQLKRQAHERGLLASPSYGSMRERNCWQNGYEQALDDIADGKLALPSSQLRSEEDS